MNEIKDISKLYIETKAGPAALGTYQYPERAIVNAVTIVTEQSWEDTVRSLIEQVHFRCNMPIYRTCVTDLFRANGFLPVDDTGKLSEFLYALDSLGVDRKYIIRTGHGYMAVVKETDGGSYVIKGPFSKEKVFKYDTSDMYFWDAWLYVPGTDNRSGIKREVKSRKLADDNKRLKVKNVNPDNKSIGDCVIRALSGAYGCTWHEAVDYIAQATNYSDPVLNVAENTKKTLLSLGFEPHKAIKRNGRFLTGKQFCEMMEHTYFDGERIFVLVGKGHCAAVVPHVRDDAGIQYVIQDTWDCTDRKICEYFVYKEKKAV